jgi:hypothetical protein
MNTCLSVKVDRTPPFSFSVTSATAGGNWQDPQQWQAEMDSRSSFNCSDTRSTIDQYRQIFGSRPESGEGTRTTMASDVAIRIQLVFIKFRSGQSLQKAVHALYLAALIREHDHYSSRGPARRCLMSTDGVSGFSQDD